ncbi:hypothetical protein BH18THE2_BH18THE2_06670 [soil metagenome]
MQTRPRITSVAIILVIVTVSASISIPFIYAFGQTSAAGLYNNKPLILPLRIKHLIILIPDEAHESLNQPKDQYPFINQAYLPQNAVINAGTMVVWFNGDVDHDHKINLSNDRNPESVLFDTRVFAFNEASRPIVLNDTGTYNYYEGNVNDNDRDFVMRGNITVISEANLNPDNSTSSLSNAGTAGVLMVPTQDIGNYVQNLKSKGFAIDSMHNFKDLRGGQKGTGDQQTLLVWTTTESDLDQVISTLKELTQELPYS